MRKINMDSRLRGNDDEDLPRGEALRGFTIMEMLVASSVILVLGAAILGLQYVFTQNSNTAINSYNNVNQANSILSRFTNEVRKADSSESGSFPFTTMNDNEIIFYSDVDYDGIAERVRYTRTAGVLERGIIEPTGNPATYDTANEVVRTLSDEVIDDGVPIFFYYNEDWPTDTINNPIPSGSRLANTKLVRIVITINDYNLDSFINPRNL